VTGFRRWLRANLWALVAVAALGTASAVYAFGFDWRDYQERNPTQPIEIARGDTGELGAARFVIDDVIVLEGDSADGRRYGVTAGTDVVVADLRITPDPEGGEDDYAFCDVVYRAPSPDGEREWWPQTTNPTSYPDPGESAFGCQVGFGPEYRIRMYFTVPAGAAEGGYVQVTTPEELPRALRLR